MILSETHIIKKSNPISKELEIGCFLSKNLYNSALFTIRQHYFNEKKFIGKYDIINKFTKEAQPDYINLPRKVSQWVINLADQNFKSFFGSLKAKKKGSIKNKIKIPSYLKKNGRQILTFTNQAVSSKELRNGYIKLSGFDFKIKTNCSNINQVRVIPRNNYFKIEVLYEVKEKEMKENNDRYVSIDLGLNNLMAIASNCLTPILINGRPLKSINQFYNKKLAQFKQRQDLLNNKNINKNKISSLHIKRNNKVKDYLHKSSRFLINHLVSNNINTLIIGKNDNWKQEINIGKRNNQNFVQIPHTQLIQIIQYKAKLEGINVILREESYTSKCSFLDNEEIRKHESYKGKRIKRGLFKSSNGRIINADINAALNILRKEVSNAFAKGIEACSTPEVLTFKQFQ